MWRGQDVSRQECSLGWLVILRRDTRGRGVTPVNYFWIACYKTLPQILTCLLLFTDLGSKSYYPLKFRYSDSKADACIPTFSPSHPVPAAQTLGINSYKGDLTLSCGVILGKSSGSYNRVGRIFSIPQTHPAPFSILLCGVG